MKYRLLILLGLFLALGLLVGCSGVRGERKQLESISPYKFTFEILGHGLYRYENKEVVCYTYYSDSVQCRFK